MFIASSYEDSRSREAPSVPALDYVCVEVDTAKRFGHHTFRSAGAGG